MEQQDLYATGGKINWSNHSGKQWVLYPLSEYNKVEDKHTLRLSYSTPRETRLRPVEDITRIFIAALFVILKNKTKLGFTRAPSSMRSDE